MLRRARPCPRYASRKSAHRVRSGEVQLAVEDGRVAERREVDREPARRRHPRAHVPLGDDRAGLAPRSRRCISTAAPAHIAASRWRRPGSRRGGAGRRTGRRRSAACGARPSRSRPRGLALGSAASSARASASTASTRSSSLARSIADCVASSPLRRVGLDVATHDRRRQLGRRHRRAAPSRSPRIAACGQPGAGLDLLGADEDPRVVAELVGHLDHRHEAGVHADHVDRPAEDAMGRGQHALQLLVVEAVARAVVVGDAAARGAALEQPLARRVEDRPPAATPRGAARRLVRRTSAAATASPAGRRSRSRGSRSIERRRRGRVALGAEADEALEHARVAGVGRPQIGQEARVDLAPVRSARDVVAPRAVPVPLGGVLAARAVDLGEDLDHAGRRADALHLGEVGEQLALEIVVGGEVRQTSQSAARRSLRVFGRLTRFGRGSGVSVSGMRSSWLRGSTGETDAAADRRGRPPAGRPPAAPASRSRRGRCRDARR